MPCANGAGAFSRSDTGVNRMSLSVVSAEPSAMEATSRPASAPAGREVRLPRKPSLTFWLVAVALEVAFGVAFVLSGADSAIDEGLSRAGIEFSSDLKRHGFSAAPMRVAALG